MLNFKYIGYLFLSIILLLFLFVSNQLDKKSKRESQNLNSVVKTQEFINLSSYFLSKINSPYKEIKYLIKNNDTVERILKKFQVNSKDLKKIIVELKKNNLTNIYAGRELTIVLKKLEDGSHSVINLVYPVNNILRIEIRQSQNNYIVKKNILKLYRKEVVIKSKIENNLYNAAVKSGIEPNIIIEFARIFGFEVDFQRDIRKGDWFEILYERFEDDNNIIKDTGKIISAY